MLQFQAVDAREPNVEDDAGGLSIRRSVQEGFGRDKALGPKAVEVQDEADCRAHRDIVVNNRDEGNQRHCSGSL